MASPSFSLAGSVYHGPPASPLRRAMLPVEEALAAGDLDGVLRVMDRVWRYNPSLRGDMAHPYARLLMRQGWDWAAAADLLRAASEAPSPQLHADLIHALRRAGQRVAATQALDRALKRFARSAGIAREARATLAEDASLFAGWVTITPAFRLYAEAASTQGVTTFSLCDPDGRVLAERPAKVAAGGPSFTDFAVKKLPSMKGLKLVADGRPLVGGAFDLPPDFAVDGRITQVLGRRIRGWARVGWLPASKPRVSVFDEREGNLRCSITRALGDGRWEFAVELSNRIGKQASVAIQVHLPDGSSQSLPGSPLVLDPASPTKRGGSPAGARRAKTERQQRPVDVIIPVYRDHERTLTCIRAVSDTTTPAAATIIVVDDASPEPALSADLDALAAAGDITLLRNERNLGFAASVNRAMALHPDRDAVLVNSDVVVFEGWLERLRNVVDGDERVGTATPLSDDDSIVGYAGIADDVAAAESHDLFSASRIAGKPIELPVGVGFCLYVRRECWDQTGAFDEAIFGRGYGEEADWCMRARRLGWRHVLAENVFVHHAGSRSFGSARAALLERSRRLLNLRHPGYDAMVARFLDLDPIATVRRDLDIARLRAAGGARALLTTVALPGGVDRAVGERVRQIRADGRRALVLQPVNLDEMRECKLWCSDLDLRHLRFSIPRELPQLRALLASMPIEFVEIHHTLGIDPRVIEMIRELGAPVDAHLHDYSWLCPRVTMIGSTGAFCGEPQVSVCESCVRRNGSNLPETIGVRDLRRRSVRWLGSMRRVVAPSADAAARIGRYFPTIPIEVVPNETFVTAGRRPLIRRALQVRVAVIGAIGRHKGYDVLLACARDAARRKLPLEFVVIGYSQDDRRLMRTGRVFVTGPYRDEEIAYLLGREAPHAVFLPSVWPETWCYTLSHAIASGLPVAAFDIGAMGERLRQESGGTLFPMGLPPREINRRLIEIGREAMGAENSAMTTVMPGSAVRPRGAASEWKQRSNG